MGLQNSYNEHNMTKPVLLWNDRVYNG